MNLRELEYIVAVADLESFSRAADACCVTQPTLSGQVKKLEDYLQVQIFERSNRQVAVTDVGREIVAVARQVLAGTRRIQEIADLARDPFTGTFALGAIQTVACYLFPALAPSLACALPDLRLVLSEDKTEALLDQLDCGTLDAALVSLPVSRAGLAVVPLFADPFLLAVHRDHPLAARERVSTAQVEGERVFLLEEGHCLRDQSLDLCGTAAATEVANYRGTSLETLRELVRDNQGVTIMPLLAMRPTDGLVYLPFEGPAPLRTIGLARRKASHREAVCDRIAGCLSGTAEWTTRNPGFRAGA